MFFVYLIESFSALFFWFIFIASGWWFVFFKLQERVYCFLPGLNTYDDNYYFFDLFFYLVWSTKLIHVVYKIKFEQCGIKFFLIDWEKTKNVKHYVKRPRGPE